MHKLEIKNKEAAKDQVTTGMNTQVLLDGKKLEGVSSVNFEVCARKVAKITIEMWAEVEVSANMNQIKVKNNG